jgi:DNA-binding phage protein
MPLTRDFKDTIRARAQHSASFRRALLTEATQALIDGELDVGKAMLRDYINATVGFQELAELTESSPKSLMRMLSPKGNPTAQNLFGIIAHLQTKEGVQLTVRPRPSH